MVAGSNPVPATSEIAGGSDIPPLLRVPSRGMYSNGYSNPCGGRAKKTIVKGHHGEEEKTVETTRWPATGKKGKKRQEICVRRDCDGKCGLKHKRVKFAVERPDPTGLEAANVRTTGRTTAKRARFVGGGLPGLGKR